MSKSALIVIPARMKSVRFPAKHLHEISGISLIRRTAKIAAEVSEADFVIATDHAEIETHCRAHDLPVVMTPEALASGSDRALAAANIVARDAKIIVNLQGDAPFASPAHIRAIIEALAKDAADIATPYVPLDWAALDALRAAKKLTPFSGTTLIKDADGTARWFSKAIIPAMRKEQDLRAASPLSPILRHIGLYAYRRAALEAFVSFPESPFEKLEGLEQLRAIENGLIIQAVEVGAPAINMPGIDTPEDAARAEALIAEHGDPFFS